MTSLVLERESCGSHGVGQDAGCTGRVARSEDKGSRSTDLQDDDDDEIEEERMTTSEAEELLRQADSEAEKNAGF